MTPRRPWVALVLVALAACDDTRFREARISLAPGQAPAPAPEVGRPSSLRVSVAAVESPQDTYTDYSRLFRHVSDRLGVPIEFVQRRTYREVNDLLASGGLDAALICTGGYLDLRRRHPGVVELVAVPVVDGKPTYESLVIVPVASPARTLADLVGKRFAFTDPLSFSGHAYVRRYVEDLGQDPDHFFSSAVFTQSHDRSLSAVAQGLVDGAAIHSGVYRLTLRREPEVAARIRVVHRSPPFGAMPVVASTGVAPELRARLREVLLSLSRDPEGEAALQLVGIDGFAAPAEGLYDAAARVVEPRR